MRTIMVTGGAGFIGSHLCERLLLLGHQVVCVDNFDNYYPENYKLQNIEGALGNQNFHFYKIDVTDYEKVAPLFELYHVDAIAHLAGRGGIVPSVERPLFYVYTNVHGTLCMLEAARHFNVPKFVFASSSSVYGLDSKVPFAESDRCDSQISPYGATKRAAELLIQTYHHLYGIDCTVLRFFTAYGPRTRPDMALNKFTERILAGEEITAYRGMKRDFTYIDDIVSGITAALDKKTGYKIINLGNSSPISVREYIRAVEKALGLKAKIVEKKANPSELLETMADISRAKKILGFNPKTKVGDGVARFVEWHRKHRLGKTAPTLKGGSVKVVVFDYDGTIINVEPQKAELFGELIKKFWGGDKKDAAKFYYDFTGPARKHKFDFYYRKIFKKPLANEEYRKIEKEFNRRLKKDVYPKAKPVPGARNLLRFARSHFEYVYICSGVPQAEINYLVEINGLKKYFDKIMGTDDHYPSKRAMLSKIIAEKNPTLTLFFSDAEIDLHTAKELGIVGIGIPSNKPAEKLKAAGAEAICAVPEAAKEIETILRNKFR